MPLTGVRVVDCATWVFGPATCAILGDWGADVVKIENPDGGDPQRGLMSVSNVPAADINYAWELDNRNKRSIGIDLQTEEGRRIAHQLVQRSDVFVTNVRTSALKRLGLDYDTLSKLNHRLIYAHGSGYGEKGTENTRPGYDHAAFWSRSGIMATLGEPGAVPPQQLPGFGDHTSSLALAGGIVLALFERERSGIGQQVDVSLLGTALWCAGLSVTSTIYTGQSPPRLSRKERANPLFNSYQTGDGRWIMLACLQSDRYWAALCKAIGKPRLKNDPRFETHLQRRQNNTALTAILDEVFLNKSAKEWGELFDKSGIIWAPAQSFWETVGDPQVLDNEFIVGMEHPVYGAIKTVASPVKLNRTPGMVRRSAPELGQHTEEILLELGYTWSDIEQLSQQKVIL